MTGSLWLLGVLGLVSSVLGCSSDGASSTSTGSVSGTVEVFSWWTAGGEADGLAALVDRFKAENPSVTFINATERGGGGTKARETLKSRLSQNQPPDTFQVHGGKELISTWVKPRGASDLTQSKMEPLNDFFAKNGWNDKFPKGLLDIVSVGGNLYSVPVNIHRGNMMFYNVKVFADAGLTPPSTMAEFTQVAGALKAKGITPVALGAKDAWAVTMIFEDMLIARGGAAFSRAYFAGEKAADDAVVTQALEDTAKIVEQAGPDAPSLGWDNAAQQLVEGKAAMTFMGDWAKGYFESKKLKAKVDFEVAPAMGTKGAFIVITDTFGLPKGAPSRANALAFLKVCGSVEGQDAFNVKKGSIPARVDADLSKYDDMQRQTIADFKAAELVATLAHGSAADEDFSKAVNDALGRFASDRNAENVLGVLRERYSQLK